MTWLEAMTPRHIRKLVPYASARRETSTGDVWLNANENPYGGFGSDGLSTLNRYPEFQPESLITAYADYSGVEREQVLLTRGIDEGIDLLTRTFCKSGADSVIFTPPTYGMYKISAETHDIKPIAIHMQQDMSLPVKEILQRAPQSKLIYLCSPNNPTGSLINPQDIRTILEATAGKSLIVVDEAYIEFKPESSIVRLIQDYPNLVILRTLSKAFGLAGLRCGFVLASSEIIQILQKVSAPYPIPVPVVDMARTALTEEGIVSMMRNVETLTKDREKMRDGLKEFTFINQIYSSAANFVLFRVDNASVLMKFLLDGGIVLRNRSNQPGLENCLRVTVGTEPEIQKFYQRMQAYEASL